MGANHNLDYQKSYSHETHSPYECFRKVALRDSEIPDLQVVLNFGHSLSKIMEMIAISEDCFTETDDPLDDMEKLDMKLSSLYLNEQDKLFYENFLSGYLSLPVYLPGKPYFNELKNISYFVELCIQNSEYCTMEYLMLFLKIIGRILESPHRILLFDATEWGSLSLSSTEQLTNIFSQYDKLKEGKDLQRCLNTYMFTGGLHTICLASLQEIFSEGFIIKRCENCGNYFVPLKRSDEKYCDEISPQDKAKTCKEYSKYANYLYKTQNDEATKLYKQIYNIKANKFRRTKSNACPKGNPSLMSDLKAFTNSGNDWRAKVKSGEKSQQEFIFWLKEIKEGVLNGDGSETR